MKKIITCILAVLLLFNSVSFVNAQSSNNNSYVIDKRHIEYSKGENGEEIKLVI